MKPALFRFAPPLVTGLLLALAYFALEWRLVEVDVVGDVLSRAFGTALLVVFAFVLRLGLLFIVPAWLLYVAASLFVDRRGAEPLKPSPYGR